MNEQDFWSSLEFRLCREFAGLPAGRYRNFWCDGFAPRAYLLDEASPRITGCCWIGDGTRLAEWDFALFLPRPAVAREKIDWAALHPAENVTRWLAFDEQRRYLEIEPAAAIPDLDKLAVAPD